MRIGAAPRIMLVAGLCAASLIGLVIGEGYARDGGQEIMLPMEAVDPRSLLSGHYVQIDLSQRLEGEAVCPASVEGDDWLALRPQGSVYVVAGAGASREQVQSVGPLPVKGAFTCQSPTPASEGVDGFPGWLRADLGIDRFYINQTDALRIERVLREQNVNEATRAFAIVSVGRDGQARLKGLLIDGERLELTWL